MNDTILSDLPRWKNLRGDESTVHLAGETFSVLAAPAGTLTGNTLAAGVTASSLTSFGNSPSFVTPNLGTPSAGVLTNCTGTAAGLTAGNVTTNANLTGPVTSAGNATTIAYLPAGIIRGQRGGLVLSNDGVTPNTILDVALGCCRDSTDAYSLYLSSAWTKTTATWASGTGNGGLDTGTIAASTWYHVHVVSKAAGANPDVLFSLSATAPTLPSTYTLRRRIGSFLTDGSSHIVAFVQRGKKFFWASPVAEFTLTNPGVVALTKTLTGIPTGVRCEALLSVQAGASVSADNPGGVYLSDLSTTDVTPSASVFSFYQFSGTAAIFQLGAQCVVWTNTSAQFRLRCQISTAGTVIRVATDGWFDDLGDND